MTYDLKLVEIRNTSTSIAYPPLKDPLECLPRNLALLCLSKLKPTDLNICRLVSKKWHQWASAKEIWQDRCKKQFGTVNLVQDVVQDFNCFSWQLISQKVQTQDFQQVISNSEKALSDDDIEVLCTKFPLNNRFNWPNKKGQFSDRLLQILTSKIPHLIEFSMDDSRDYSGAFSRITKEAIKVFAESVTRLRILKVKLRSDNRNPWNGGLIEFATHCKKLTHVEINIISNCVWITNSTVNTLVNRCQRLSYLKLHDVSMLNDETIKNIGNIQKLTSLSLKFVRGDSIEALSEALTHLKVLQVFDLTGSISTLYIQKFQSALAQNTGLRKLSLSCELKSKDLLSILEALPNLQEVTFPRLTLNLQSPEKELINKTRVLFSNNFASTSIDP